MLIAPDDLGFAGAVLALAVIGGEETIVAGASLYCGRPTRVHYKVPETVAYPDVPELTRLLNEFSEKLRVAEEKVKT